MTKQTAASLLSLAQLKTTLVTCVKDATNEVYKKFKNRGLTKKVTIEGLYGEKDDEEGDYYSLTAVWEERAVDFTDELVQAYAKYIEARARGAVGHDDFPASDKYVYFKNGVSLRISALMSEPGEIYFELRNPGN